MLVVALGGAVLVGAFMAGAGPADSSAVLVWSGGVVNHGGVVNDISCPSTTLCVATDGGTTILTSTDPAGGASTWTKTATPDDYGLVLVTCPATTLCLAFDGFGRVLASTDPAGGGATWFLTTAGRIDPAGWDALSCPSTNLCVADDNNGHVLTSTDPLGGVWSGSAAFPGESSFGALQTISCPSTTLCVMADNGGNVLTSTNPTGGTAAWTSRSISTDFQGLGGLDCPTTTFCVGAGESVVTSTDPTGDATAWTSSTGAYLGNSLTCPSTTFCASIDGEGSNAHTTTDPAGGAAAWHTTDIDGAAVLNVIACPSPALCVAGDQLGQIVTGTAPTAPAAPTSVAAVAGNGQASVSFSAPDDGGSTITGYTVTASPGGATATGSGSPIVVGGLNNGTSYTFTVTATNDVGTGTASDPSNSVVPAAAPSIVGFSPSSGGAGTSVTITGANFTGATVVTFHGTAAQSFSVDSDTQVTAVVAAGSTSGTIAVTTPSGTGTSSGTFTFVPPPTITSFTPSAGGAHATVTVTGTSLTDVTHVKLNGTSAAFSSLSATELTFTVPPGASTGTIQVTSASGSATSVGAFTVRSPPTITSLSPENGPVGTSVTITGTNLAGTVGVMLGSIVTVPTSVSATQVVFTIPPGASTGVVRILNPAGSATSPGTFTVTP